MKVYCLFINSTPVGVFASLVGAQRGATKDRRQSTKILLELRRRGATFIGPEPKLKAPYKRLRWIRGDGKHSWLAFFDSEDKRYSYWILQQQLRVPRSRRRR